MNPQIIEKAGKVIVVTVGVAVGVCTKKYGPKILELLRKMVKK